MTYLAKTPEGLLPCPHCGGEAEFETYGGTACAVVCQSCRCGTPTMSLADGTAAVNRWNLRAERTCRNASLDPLDFKCSECGAEDYTSDSLTVWADGVPRDASYCPHCGARIIKEDA